MTSSADASSICTPRKMMRSSNSLVYGLCDSLALGGALAELRQDVARLRDVADESPSVGPALQMLLTLVGILPGRRVSQAPGSGRVRRSPETSRALRRRTWSTKP